MNRRLSVATAVAQALLLGLSAVGCGDSESATTTSAAQQAPAAGTADDLPSDFEQAKAMVLPGTVFSDIDDEALVADINRMCAFLVPHSATLTEIVAYGERIGADRAETLGREAPAGEETAYMGLLMGGARGLCPEESAYANRVRTEQLGGVTELLSEDDRRDAIAEIWTSLAGQTRWPTVPNSNFDIDDLLELTEEACALLNAGTSVEAAGLRIQAAFLEIVPSATADEQALSAIVIMQAASTLVCPEQLTATTSASATTVPDTSTSTPETTTAPESVVDLMNEATALADAGRSEEAIGVYDQVVSGYGDSDDPGTSLHVVQALTGKAMLLIGSGRPEEAIVAYDEAINRFRDSSDPDIAIEVGIATVGKMATLYEVGRLGLEEALNLFDEAMARLEEGSDPGLAQWVARALIYKGYALGDAGHSEDAIPLFDEVIDRYEDSGDPEIVLRVAIAIANKGLELARLGRFEEAISILDGVIDMYGDSSIPGMAAVIHTARVWRDQASEAMG
jgi:tetratricopeptide (TPR) repeat protein